MSDTCDSKVTGWRVVLNFFWNWREIWLWLPLALLSIWGMAEFGYFLTGRRPTENVDWIVGTAGNLVKCVFIIALLSIKRESTGVWLTKIEWLANPKIAWVQAFSEAVALCVFAYLLSH